MVEVNSTNRIAVVGAGLMGRGIALACAQAGIRVQLMDIDRGILAGAIREIGRTLDVLVKNRFFHRRQAENAKNLIVPKHSLEEAVAHAGLVQEAVQEDLGRKRALFAQLDRICSRGTILATNTSTIRIGDIAGATSRPDRVIGVHWISPAYLVPMIEVVVGRATSERIVQRAKAFARRLGKAPIVVKDIPGFVFNRIQLAMLNEAIALLAKGVASAADIDTAIRLGLGSRLVVFGPLRCNDVFVTKATTLRTFSYLYGETGEDKFRPSRHLRRMIANGNNGLFSGKGFYAYSGSAARGLARRDKALITMMTYLRAFERRNLRAL